MVPDAQMSLEMKNLKRSTRSDRFEYWEPRPVFRGAVRLCRQACEGLAEVLYAHILGELSLGHKNLEE